MQTSLASLTLLTVSTGSVSIRLTRDVLDPLILEDADNFRQQQTAEVGIAFDKLLVENPRRYRRSRFGRQVCAL